MASPLQLIHEAVVMQESGERVEVVHSSCWEGLTVGLASRPSGLVLAPSSLQLIDPGGFLSVEKKAPNWDKGPLTGPLPGPPRIGQGRAFAAFPGRRAQRARWVEPSPDSVPSEMVFADTIRIAVSNLDYWDAYISPPLGSCPGSTGSVPRNTRPERELRAFSSCSALYLTWRFPRSVCL